VTHGFVSNYLTIISARQGPRRCGYLGDFRRRAIEERTQRDWNQKDGQFLHLLFSMTSLVAADFTVGTPRDARNQKSCRQIQSACRFPERAIPRKIIPVAGGVEGPLMARIPLTSDDRSAAAACALSPAEASAVSRLARAEQVGTDLPAGRAERYR